MEEETIKIKKNDLWKFTTFVLIAIVLIGGFFMFKGGKTTTNNSIANTEGAVNLQVFIDDASLYPSLGPDNAENVVIEFSDFQCPYCALASGLPVWVQDYQSQYSDLIGSAGKIQQMATDGKIRFIYVPMSFLGQESVYAAQAGLCANQQEKFWEMHDALFTSHDGQENNGKFSKNNLKEIAKDIPGIDIGKFDSCFDNDETLSDVQKVASEASKVVSGTPAFYVNGQQVSASWTQLSSSLA